MGRADGEREQGMRSVRERSARTVARVLKAKAELLRDSAPHVVLALVAGASLAPVAVAAAVGGVPVALGGVVGGVGTNVLTDLVNRAIARLRREEQGRPEPAAMADAIADDILAALRRNDAVAAELSRQLISAVGELGGFDAALGAAGGELRDHLAACFGDLRAGQQQLLGAMGDVRNEQHRQRGYRGGCRPAAAAGQAGCGRAGRHAPVLAWSLSWLPSRGTARRRARTGALARKSPGEFGLLRCQPCRKLWSLPKDA